MICAWIETSSAETGSSPTISSGFSARARAMPMRWRCPPENSCGKRVGQLGPQPDPLEQMRDPVAAFARVADAVDDQRLADDLAGRHPRVQRGVGVLIDHLHAPAIRQHRVAVEAGDVVAVEP